MEVASAVEKHTPRETALQRLLRQTREFFAAIARTVLLAGALTLILLASFLTIDLPFRSLDFIFGGAEALRPSNWLTRGALIMALGPLLAILITRKYGGDEASRTITAAWALAALAVFAELSYLAPVLEDGDLPGVRFTVAFVASAMAAQYMAVSVYDVARGSGRWWRAPLFGALAAYLAHTVIYFPAIFWSVDAPWFNWMVTDFTIRMLLAGAFLPVYAMLRKSLRPKGGYGGR